jgi:hypothetical protein
MRAGCKGSAWRMLAIAGFACVPAVTAFGQSDETVSRSEYEALQQRITELEATLQRLQAQPESDETVEDLEEWVGDLETELNSLRSQVDATSPGTTGFLFTGYATIDFKNVQGDNSTFGASFNPIFLWKLEDNILFSAELEIELENNMGVGETNTELEYANLAWTVTDNLTLRAGKFLTPLSTFQENRHPAWIRKLPDKPLFATSGPTRITPVTSLGVEARGAYVFDSNARLTYSVYVSNGARIQDMGATAGSLEFDNFEDLNNSKAIGAKIGFLPVPELEFTYGFNFGDAGISTMPNLNYWIHDVSISYAKDSEKLKGRLDVRLEAIYAMVDDADYGGGVFENERWGGYGQVAYRPTGVDSKLTDFEGVVRWDFIDLPAGATESFTERRLTAGINYWINPSTVIKCAYRWDDLTDVVGPREESDAFLVQLAIGF